LEGVLALRTAKSVYLAGNFPFFRGKRIMEKPRRYHIMTWGCQMNVHDSEKIAGILSALGCCSADRPEDADIILLNTCSIREKAAQKAYTEIGRIRKLKRRNPNLVLAVCGCVAQQEKEKLLQKAPHIDFILGPKCVADLARVLEQGRPGEPSIHVALEGNVYRETPTVARSSSVKAFVTIMEGCDNFCSYCIVPFVRGREISRPVDAILEEIRGLALRSCREVELLGQNVNSYRHNGSRFPDLLTRVGAVEGIERVRFTTSHPKDFNEETIEAMAACPKICNHIHLPAQSGSTRVLERMNRGYTAGQYRAKIEALRRRIPGIAVSTDLIVGFPGETEEDFEMTLSLVREVRFDSLFSFKYSPRPLTRAAAAFPDTVAPGEKQRRLEVLQGLQREIQTERYRSLLGTEVEVLVDGFSRKDPGCASGRTSDNKVVNLERAGDLFGRIVAARITQAHPNSLAGRVLRLVS
jgi:tRNA-2-methylthio-N6-dimethylallyladenosine synthase